MHTKSPSSTPSPPAKAGIAELEAQQDDESEKQYADKSAMLRRVDHAGRDHNNSSQIANASSDIDREHKQEKELSSAKEVEKKAFNAIEFYLDVATKLHEEGH